jgi:ABC-2 type transport system permease protein
MNWIGLFTFVRRELERILRVKVQTFAAPLISATLFIFIFGFVLGSKIDLIAGVSYMAFVFPGILTMNILASAFEHTSSSVFFGRWVKSIHEILVAPFSYVEMLVGLVGSAVLRSLLVGCGILIIGLLFGAVSIVHPLVFILVVIAIATIFALLGILVGLWANGFEQLGILNTFIISPLTMLGGMFYSITYLPELVQNITRANPFFYFIDMMRYATLGIHESNLLIGASMILGLIIALSFLVIYLFRIGWRIRE